jgi:hypothetical protein
MKIPANYYPTKRIDAAGGISDDKLLRITDPETDKDYQISAAALKAYIGGGAGTIPEIVNNILRRSPKEMEMSLEEFLELIKLNTSIAKRWNALCIPITDQLKQRYRIMQPVSNGVINLNGSR